MASVNDRVGNYRLIAKLACGSFGCVYRSEHFFLKNRIVAVKVIHSAQLNSQKEQDLFLEEARLLEMLKHPHILSIIDVGIHEDCPYLVTEYAPNGSLLDRIKREVGKPLPVEEALTMLEQIGQALQHAHEQGIVHRDLKPENILFKANGDMLLADFGIARMLDTIGIRQGTIIGTPSYMAPEQFRGTASKESDQYALGCLAYELFTGRKPFIAPDFVSMMFKQVSEQPVASRQLDPQLPVHIEQAILKAMAKERSERHADVAAFITTLRSPQKTKDQWLEEGNDHLNGGHYEEALVAYDCAILLDPNLALAYDSKGDALSDLKRYDEALAAYEHAILLDPNLAVAYHNKALALERLGRTKEAQQAREIARQLGYSG